MDMDADNFMDFEAKYLEEVTGLRIGQIVYLKSDFTGQTPMTVCGHLDLMGEPVKVSCHWLDKYSRPRQELYSHKAVTTEPPSIKCQCQKEPE
jgi:hypothetical protein